MDSGRRAWGTGPLGLSWEWMRRVGTAAFLELWPTTASLREHGRAEGLVFLLILRGWAGA